MHAKYYLQQAEDLLARIDRDRTLGDLAYVELMDEVAELADSRATAKRCEMEREEEEHEAGK